MTKVYEVTDEYGDVLYESPNYMDALFVAAYLRVTGDFDGVVDLAAVSIDEPAC